jgi:hypothetical protein
MAIPGVRGDERELTRFNVNGPRGVVIDFGPWLPGANQTGFQEV